MKKSALFLVLILVLFGCGKKEEANLELFSPEAFCYQLDSGWELNATVNAKGFMVKEKDGKYYFKISYVVDILTPGNNIKSAVYKNVIEKRGNERLGDVALECQTVLDSTSEKGIYTVIFKVKDELSGQTKDINKTFTVD